MTAERSAPEPEDGERSLGFLIHDVARLRKAIFDGRMKRFGLTRSQWRVIGHLHRRDGITQSELGRGLEMNKVTLVRILDRLEDKGWIARRVDSGDRRARRVYLTRELSGVRRELDAVTTEVNERCFANVSDRDRKRLVATLLAMRTNLQELDDNRRHSDVASRKAR